MLGPDPHTSATSAGLFCISMQQSSIAPPLCLAPKLLCAKALLRCWWCWWCELRELRQCGCLALLSRRQGPPIFALLDHACLLLDLTYTPT